MYNDKVSEVKDIIGIGPAVKNILTVSQLEDTCLSFQLNRSRFSLQVEEVLCIVFRSTIHFYVILKECFKKLKKLSNWLEKFKPISGNRNRVMTVIRKLRYAIKLMKSRLKCGWKQFSC